MKSTIFWDIMLCSPLKAELCLPPSFTLVSCTAYVSTLKMEAKGSSEMSVDSQQTTRRYIPEDGALDFFSFAMSLAELHFMLL
jgi:hypothetical protein